MMSIPYVENGHGEVIVCNGIGDMCFKSPWT